MTFEGQYLTYAEYQALGGSAIGDKPFNLLEFEARRQIDIRTFNRIKNCEEIPQEVKLCDYELINTIKSFASSKEQANGNISSEHIDGYSVNYITPDKISEVVKSIQEEIDYIIRTYLLDVVIDGQHIMYCGVR